MVGTGGVPGIQTLRAHPFTHQELPKELSQSLAQVEGQQGGCWQGGAGHEGCCGTGTPLTASPHSLESTQRG